MKARIVLLRCLLGLLVLSVTSTTADDEENIEEFKIPDKFPDIPYDQVASELVSQSVMNFAHDLAVALDTNDYPNTEIFSPLSVMSALSILHMGSYGNSYNQLNQLFALLNKQNETNSSKIHEEFGWLLQDVMLNSVPQPKRLRSSTEWRSKPFNKPRYGGGGKNELGDHTIRVSNGLFIQNGFSLRPDYAYAAQSVYKSEVTPLDFRHNSKDSKHYINSWVKQNTMGKIPSLIDDELSSETNMVLASTLYFKGFWEKVFFDTDNKHKEPFYPDGPESIPVGITFMGTGGTFPFYDSKEYNCRIIGLPYKGNQTTMYVIQPNDSTRLNLQQLQKNLTGEIINELISKMEYQNAIIAFPKFHVENKMRLKAPLQRMGIEDIFINGQADLALVTDSEQNKEIPASSSYPSSSWTAKVIPIPQHFEAALNNIEDATTSPSFGTKSAPSSNSEVIDRFGDSPLIFSRFSEESENQTTVTDRPEQQNEMENTKKDENDEIKESEISQENSTIMPSEGITELIPEEKPSSSKRRRRRDDDVSPSTKSLQRLDQMRSMPGLKKPSLYVDEIVHKVDFNVNEQGTEAAAATAGFLLKSGPEVSMRCDTPFLILVRHDPTKLPLFYGIINIPV